MLTHPWLESYPIKKKSKYLIIGTHPPMPYSTNNVQFYYGNMNEFWRLISEVYPTENIFPSREYSLESIKKFLNKYQFSITDMVYKTENNNFSIDSQMKVVELNPFLKKWLNDSTIEEIFFTSFNSGKNSALSLFKKWLKKEKIPHEKIPAIKHWLQNGLIVKINDKKIKLVALYSPSPTARRGIPKSIPYIEWVSRSQCRSNCVDLFRINWYKKFFPKY